MKNITKLILEKICEKIVVQGSHKKLITEYYQIIRNAAGKEFSEDNQATLDSFLQECFNNKGSIMKRQDVYKLIDGERAYQDRKQILENMTSDGTHSIEEWLVHIEDYVNEAKHLLSRNAKQNTDKPVMDIFRKIAGMAVYAMEQHETLPRK